MDLAIAEEKFNETGNVTFEVTKKESVLIKKSIQLLVRLEKLSHQKGLWIYFLKKAVMFRGIIASIRMSFLSQDASEIFDFFALNKNQISGVEAKDMNADKVSFLFIKK